MCLMMTLMLSSQNTNNDSIRILKPTFVKIMKDVQKCRSLRTAFDLKSQTLDTLILHNLKTIDLLTIERENVKALELQIVEREEEIKAISKKRGGWLIPSLIGLSAGLIINSL